ncbi:MAG TPA: PRC-barrel domain-containing protein [Methylomirabilota bacterium]|jgi:sporulation protein YlmC with PRC-barrel domain|nr:PRC-barrel domain-containing protein [Methylomirabilota bacterium]
MKAIAILLAITALTTLPVGVAMSQQQAPMSQQQAPAAGQPAATQGSAQQQVLVGSDSLVGSTVRNSEGRDVGKVSRLMVDPSDGRVVSVVIATGGSFGLNSSTIAIPWSSVKVGQDAGRVVVTTSQGLESAPKAERASDRPADRSKEGTPASAPATEQPPRRQ